MSKTSRQNLIYRLDTAVRIQTLVRDDYACQRCRKHVYDIEVHHIVKRANKSVRWEADNLLALCKWTCHIWYEANPREGDLWFAEKWPDRWKHIEQARKESRRWWDSDLEELLQSLK